MSTAAETIRKLLLAHASGNEEAFRAAAWEIVERERRVNHHVLANELERILSKGENGRGHRSLSPLPHVNGSVPKDKDRNAQLVELVEARRDLDELVLAPSVRVALDRIVLEWRQGELLSAHGVRPIAKVLFCGPPGCGKTVAAEAVAKALYLPLTIVRFDAVVSSYLGETAANLRRVFEFARSRPMVLFFDEFDAIGKHRTADDEHGELKRVVNSFLQLLDGFHAETLTIAATNHQGLLDSALWRRFDEIVLFPRPTQDEIEELLCRLLRQLGIEPSVKLWSVAESLAGFSQADIERVAMDAIKATILENASAVSEKQIRRAVERQQSRRAITEGTDRGMPKANRSQRKQRKSSS